MSDLSRNVVLTKAYAISYAVFRVAAKIQNVALREHLERQALGLLNNAASGDRGQIENAAKAVEYLVRFGSDVGLLNERNAETIIVELNALNVLVEESGNENHEVVGPAEVQLEDIFKTEEVKPMKEEVISEPAIQPAMERMTVAEAVREESGNPAIRQTAILERIRQSGNCRLKDIQEVLPDLSERTIRYYLQSLSEQNLIERVGNGGPSVYYRVRQGSPVLPR